MLSLDSLGLAPFLTDSVVSAQGGRQKAYLNAYSYIFNGFLGATTFFATGAVALSTISQAIFSSGLQHLHPQPQPLDAKCLWQPSIKPTINIAKIPRPLNVYNVKIVAKITSTMPTIPQTFPLQQAEILQLFISSISFSMNQIQVTYS